MDITLGIFKIDMPFTIKAGQVTFHVTNSDSSDTHEFVVFKTDLAPGQFPLDSSNNVDETSQSLTKIDEIPAGMFTGYTVQ